MWACDVENLGVTENFFPRQASVPEARPTISRHPGRVLRSTYHKTPCSALQVGCDHIQHVHATPTHQDTRASSGIHSGERCRRCGRWSYPHLSTAGTCTVLSLHALHAKLHASD